MSSEELQKTLKEHRRDRAAIITAADFLKNNRRTIVPEAPKAPVYSLSSGVRVKIHPGFFYYAVEIVAEGNGEGGKSFLSLPKGYGGCSFRSIERSLDREALAESWEIPCA